MNTVMDRITYQSEDRLVPEEFVEVLKKSSLALRRPVDDPEKIAKMCLHANLNVTARLEGKLIGVARSLTDFVFCTYLSDLAVDAAYQKMGIGKRLIAETKKRSLPAKLILLSAPAAVNYYPRIGMTRFDQCYLLDNLEDLRQDSIISAR